MGEDGNQCASVRGHPASSNTTRLICWGITDKWSHLTKQSHPATYTDAPSWGDLWILCCMRSYVNTINTIPVQLLESFWTNQLWQVEQNNLIQGWFHIWAARHLHKLFTVCSLSCDRHVVCPERRGGCSKYSALSLFDLSEERGLHMHKYMQGLIMIHMCADLSPPTPPLFPSHRHTHARTGTRTHAHTHF